MRITHNIWYDSIVVKASAVEAIQQLETCVMNELTLESLAARVADLEKRMDGKPVVIAPTRDWRSVVGISEETEFSRSMQAEMTEIRKVESDASSEGFDG